MPLKPKTWTKVDTVMVAIIIGSATHPVFGFFIGFILFLSASGWLRRHDSWNRRRDREATDEEDWVMRPILACFLSLVAAVFVYYKVESLQKALPDHRARQSAPGAIRDLKAELGTDSLKVSWLASGFKGYEGSSRSYVLCSRSALAPLSQTQPNLPNLPTYTVDSAPAGTPLSFERPLAPSGVEQTYHFTAIAEGGSRARSVATTQTLTIPPTAGVLYESEGRFEDWTKEGEWKSKGTFGDPRWLLGEALVCDRYQPQTDHFATSPVIALPSDQPCELAVNIDCRLDTSHQAVVWLEIRPASEEAWEELEAFRGDGEFLGVKRYSLAPWQGREVELRFRLNAPETTTTGSHQFGLAFNQLTVRTVTEKSEEEALREKEAEGPVEAENQDEARTEEDRLQNQ